jgi:GR25 family glycosyltransferase involved in LPS biosynthesis
MSKYKGFYINLDKSIDRRIFIEHQLRQCNVLDIYNRFSAIDGKDIINNSTLMDCELACKQSHINILFENKNSDKHIHIIEDDIRISQQHNDLLNQFFTFHEDKDWDILFTGFQIPLSSRQIDFLVSIYSEKKEITFFNMQNFLFVGAFSYLINKKSIPKIIDIYNKSDINMPIDFILRKHICLDKDLTAYSVFPMFIRHAGDFKTTMEGRYFELTYEYQYLFQKPFIIDTDINEIFKEIQQYAQKIKYKIQNTDINIRNIYDILLDMGEYIISSNVVGKYDNTNTLDT